MHKLPLLDKYTAYQSLADSWTRIAVDLEYLQAEGIECCRKIDDVIEINEDGEEESVGREGHVLPFELIQKHILTEDWNKIQEMKKLIETTENQINSKAENICELLGEDAEFGFSAKDVSSLKDKIAKNEIEENAEEIKTLLAEGEKLQGSLKVAKKTCTDIQLELYGKTIRAYDDLSEEQIKNLLEIKWIKGLCEDLEKQCDDVIDSLVEKLELLNKKYSVTYERLQNEIASTKETLCGLMDELVANEFDKKGIEEFQKILRG